MTTNQIFYTVLILYIVFYIALWIIVRRRFKRTIKQIDHAHKIQQTTLLDDDDIRWEELGIFSEQHPLHEYRAGCN